MNIELCRTTSDPFCVIGTFSVDGRMYHSMELPLLFGGQGDVPDKTCVPEGTFPVQNLWSGKHQCLMPHIIIPHVDGVPDRTEIEIHSASRPSDLLGCVAIGNNLYNGDPLSANDVVINESLEAFNEFYADFVNALRAGETVTITIFWGTAAS